MAGLRAAVRAARAGGELLGGRIVLDGRTMTRDDHVYSPCRTTTPERTPRGLTPATKLGPVKKHRPQFGSALVIDAVSSEPYLKAKKGGFSEPIAKIRFRD